MDTKIDSDRFPHIVEKILSHLDWNTLWSVVRNDKEWSDRFTCKIGKAWRGEGTKMRTVCMMELPPLRVIYKLRVCPSTGEIIAVIDGSLNIFDSMTMKPLATRKLHGNTGFAFNRNVVAVDVNGRSLSFYSRRDELKMIKTVHLPHHGPNRYGIHRFYFMAMDADRVYVKKFFGNFFSLNLHSHTWKVVCKDKNVTEHTGHDPVTGSFHRFGNINHTSLTRFDKDGNSVSSLIQSSTWWPNKIISYNVSFSHSQIPCTFPWLVRF